jgi:hypothetical protein
MRSLQKILCSLFQHNWGRSEVCGDLSFPFQKQSWVMAHEQQPREHLPTSYNIASTTPAWLCSCVFPHTLSSPTPSRVLHEKARAHKGGMKIGKTPKKLDSICCPQCRETNANRRRGPGTREKVSLRRINLEGNTHVEEINGSQLPV